MLWELVWGVVWCSHRMSPKRDFIRGEQAQLWENICFSLPLVIMVLTYILRGAFPKFGLNELKGEFQWLCYVMKLNMGFKNSYSPIKRFISLKSEYTVI